MQRDGETQETQETAGNCTQVAQAKSACGCGWRGVSTQLLRAPDPFNDGDELVACPECRQRDDLYEPCETDGCWRQASCGGTFADEIYRRTCSDHARRYMEPTRRRLDGRSANA